MHCWQLIIDSSIAERAIQRLPFVCGEERNNEDVMGKNEENWLANYEALKAYVIEHKHLPDKHKETDRNKLSWWKYQMKKKKAGTLTDEQIRLLDEVAGMRSMEHTGGRRKQL